MLIPVMYIIIERTDVITIQDNQSDGNSNDLASDRLTSPSLPVSQGRRLSHLHSSSLSIRRTVKLPGPTSFIPDLT